MRSSRGQLCDRARQWASLRVDGELSELEHALLETHVARCEPCRAFVREAEAVAAALRAVSLQRLPEPVQLVAPARHGRVPMRIVQTATVAALVLVAAALGSALGVANRADRPTRSALRHTAMVAMAESPDNLRALRRATLVAGSPTNLGRSIPRNRRIPGDTV
jgi:predicted anti-sigma-YlaC factor YlaD